MTALPVSGVVNVTVNMSPVAAATRNFGTMLILGASNVITVEERIREYGTISAVLEDFGTEAPEYLAAQAFFAQSPRPKSVMIGRMDSENETLQQAVAAMLDQNGWYGLFVAAEYDKDAAVAVSQLIEAASPSRIVAWTSQDDDELNTTNSSTLGYALANAKLQRSLVCYSSTSKYAAMSILGRMATVNFEGSQTCITLKFKQLPGVGAETLTSTQASALKKNNVNVFVNYDNDTSILQEGTMSNGFFIDEVHGLDWLQNRVETDLWNLLYTSTTKIGQDEAGINRLVATVSRSCAQGVANGLAAPGVWNGDEFGALKAGDTLAAGYYVYIQPLEEQSQADREARKAPPIQVAIKLKGAVHFADVGITVNR